MGNLVGKFVSAWANPWGAMRGVKEEGEGVGIVPSMIFIVVMGLLSGLITSIGSTIVPPPDLAGSSKAAVWLAVAVVPLVSFVGSFIGAFIIWGLVDGFLKGSMIQYKTSYRLLAVLAAFSPVSALLAPIPKAGQYLAMAVNIWATIVMIQGIIIVMDTPKLRTWVICGILFASLFALGLAARVAAQRQLAGGPNFSDLNDNFGTDDVSFESDTLDKELQEMADKAKADAEKK